MTLKTSSRLLAALSLILLVPSLALAQFPREERATVEVAADRTAYEPGSTARITAKVEIEELWHVNSNPASDDYLIPTELSLKLPEGFAEPRVEYPEAHIIQFDGRPLSVYDGTFLVHADLDIPGDASGNIETEAALRYQACDDRVCEPPITVRLPLTLAIGSGGEPVNTGWTAIPANPLGKAGPTAVATETAAVADESESGLLWMLLLGVLGGFILNAMPCVLPVLSLKVFAFINSAGKGRSHLTMGTLATTAGIMVSFWALAGAAVLAKQAGAAVGWGVQFQQPAFVTFLAVVMVLFALNMWGLFEIPLPQSLAQAAGGSQGEGAAGHFASGLFATLMATPCSAPFLGTAIGFALVQSTAVIFAIFTAVGFGFALPYVLLAIFPSAAKIFPKPGNWMLTFKNIMGFLLAAAAVWLFYVLAAQVSPERLAFIQLTLLALALCTWLFHHYAGKPNLRRLSSLGMVATIGWCIYLAAAAPPAQAGNVSASKLIDWVSFDETEAKRLANEGQIVFVDFTADWCLTCKANARLVIETPEVASTFEDHSVVPMKADWTNRDDAITSVLASYGRAAVPFYLLYRPGQEPHAFGEIVTKGGLIEAVEEAAAAGKIAAR